VNADRPPVPGGGPAPASISPDPGTASPGPGVPSGTASPGVGTGPAPTAAPTGRPTSPQRADHAAIERLVDGLLPALAARLGLGDLDELEIREGGWRVRLRRPRGQLPVGAAEAGPRTAREPGGSGSSGPASRGATRGSGAARGAASGGSRAGTSLVGIGPAALGQDGERGSVRGRVRRPVTSPAVGIFQPGGSFAVGRRVRAGDRLGTIDVLGVPHDVLAPLDGLVLELRVEAGDPVEYGQELGIIEAVAPEVPTPEAVAPEVPTPESTSVAPTQAPAVTPEAPAPGAPEPQPGGEP
jgi:biotin carboxyl carrier protein